MTLIKRLLAGTAFLAGLAGTWGATHYAGSHYGIQGSQFPPPPAHALVTVYHPFAIYQWALHADRPWPSPFMTYVAVAAASTALGLAGFGFALTATWRQAGSDATDSQPWGTEKDAEKAGLLHGRGSRIVVLGRMGDKLLSVTDGRHVLFLGPTGTGKTRSGIIPTLLAYAGSVVSYSAGKLDVWEATSGYRSRFSDVRLLDLGNPHACRFNPLDEVRLGHHEMDDCLLIAGQFPEKRPQDAREPFWDIAATMLLAGVILHVLYTADRSARNLTTVHSLLHQRADILTRALDRSPHPEVQKICNSIMHREQKARDNILTTAATYLKPWLSQTVKDLTADSDFSINDLVSGDSPMSLYLRVPSNMREEWRVVLKIIIAQIVRTMMFDERIVPDGRSKRFPLLLAIDEFQSFVIPGFQNDLAEMRSYGMQALLSTQSYSTLEDAYGEHQTIAENCRIKLFMASGDPATQHYLSEQVGATVAKRTSHSRSWRRGELFGGSQGESVSEYTKPVLTVGDVREIPADEMLLIVTGAGAKTMRVKKLIDFDTVGPFSERILPAADPCPDRRWRQTALDHRPVAGWNF